MQANAWIHWQSMSILSRLVAAVFVFVQDDLCTFCADHRVYLFSDRPPCAHHLPLNQSYQSFTTDVDGRIRNYQNMGSSPFKMRTNDRRGLCCFKMARPSGLCTEISHILITGGMFLCGIRFPINCLFQKTLCVLCHEPESIACHQYQVTVCQCVSECSLRSLVSQSHLQSLHFLMFQPISSSANRRNDKIQFFSSFLRRSCSEHQLIFPQSLYIPFTVSSIQSTVTLS